MSFKPTQKCEKRVSLANPTLSVPVKHSRPNSAGKKKIAAVLVVSLLTLIAIPLSLAVANPNFLFNNVLAAIAGTAEAPDLSMQATAEFAEPMTLEQGIETLAVGDRYVVDIAAGDAMIRWPVGSGHTGFSLAILNDGTLWAWGANRQGALGLGDDSEFMLNVPTQVGTANTWTSVFAGRSQSMAIQSDGTLWIWGDNTSGQAGQGFISDNISIPTQVGTGTNWVYATAINNTGGLGSAHDTILAIQSDGTLWAWGSNNSGRTGLGITVGHTLTPTQVGSSSNWTSVSGGIIHSLAVQSDGTLWAWGSNSSGRTGLGITSGTTLVPTQVGDGTNWVSVSAGVHYSLAVQSDGTLWAWGSNTSGQTGLDTTVGNAPVPTQVGSSASWAGTVAGTGHSLGIQSDGTLWAWGSNNNGQTGLGIGSGNTLVPTQVGSSSNWTSISAGQQHSLAVQSNGTLWASGGNNSGATGQGSAAGNTLTLSPVGPVAVTTMAPAGTGLAPDSINTLTVNFDFPVRSGIGDRVLTLTNTATNNTVALGQWVLASDGLSMTAPITGAIDYETTYRINISGWHSVFGAPLAPANQTFATGDRAQPPEGVFTKTLTLPEGTTIPSPTFTFNFAAQQVVLDDTVTPNISSRPSADFATLLNNQTITLNAADAVTENGTTTITGNLDIAAILSSLTFPGGGVYVWNVSELSGSSNTTTPSHMSYDDTLFQIRAWVNRYGDLEYIAIHNLERGEGTTIIDLGKTEDGINFFNTYMRQTGTEDNPAFEVSKEVTGDLANLDTLFNFTLSLAGHTLAPITNTPPATLPTTHFTARIVNSEGIVVDRAVTITPGANSTYTLSFQLRHGESLQIPTLPAGTTFTTTEAAHPEFSPSATITLGGTQLEADYTQEVNTALTTGSHIMRDTGSNSADFTNDHFSAPHTGLVVTSNVPLALIVGMGLLLTVMLALRNRQRIERMPL